MSASQIPNLNALRSARSGTSGRGRGRGALGGRGEDNDEDRQSKDHIVQRTDQDASMSRMSAVELGYLDDQFAKAFVVEATQRRFPIINRGSYSTPLAGCLNPCAGADVSDRNLRQNQRD
jgi:[phosphatase 2A protein]-leucine-carboxy methyltransferase